MKSSWLSSKLLCRPNWFRINKTGCGVGKVKMEKYQAVQEFINLAEKIIELKRLIKYIGVINYSISWG